MIDYHDTPDLAGELVRARIPERRVSTRPMPTVVQPEQAVPPRRFAKGTDPGGTTRVGLTPAPARPGDDDDHTTPSLSLGDYTTPDVPLADRTQPGLAIHIPRSRSAR